VRRCLKGGKNDDRSHRSFLLWCTVIDYAVLLVWFLAFVLAHDWIHAIHSKWFRLSREQLDALHYAGMSIFKSF
jgi:hypothetical protein